MERAPKLATKNDKVCRKMYTTPQTIAADVKRQSASTSFPDDWSTVEVKITEKYEDRIIVKSGKNRFDLPVICFTDSGYKLLNDARYEQEK